MLQIAVIVGSLRKDSYNRKLALAMDKLQHPSLNLSLLKIEDIPLYNQDLDTQLPEAVTRFKNDIAAADGVLFVTPEYNRSIPGVLKNIIDWGTRPAGQNVWAKKTIAAMGTSPGAIGTAVAQSHLRSIMVGLDAIMFGQPDVFLVYKEGLIDDDNTITVEATKAFLQNFLDRFAQNVEKYSHKK